MYYTEGNRLAQYAWVSNDLLIDWILMCIISVRVLFSFRFALNFLVLQKVPIYGYDMCTPSRKIDRVVISQQNHITYKVWAVQSFNNLIFK